jgi:hypothetical protein
MSKASKGLLLALLVTAFFPPALQARDSCNPKGSMNVCEWARELANEVAKELPKRLNPYVTRQTVFASDNIFTELLEYNRSLTLSKETEDQLVAGIRENQRNAFCVTDRDSKAFIDSGGVWRSLLIFKGGSVFRTITLASCD